MKGKMKGERKKKGGEEKKERGKKRGETKKKRRGEKSSTAGLEPATFHSTANRLQLPPEVELHACMY